MRRDRTRTYGLLFAQPSNPLFWLMKSTFLNLSQTVVEQDATILEQLYQNQPQQIKLDCEMGMDWVKRNFAHWPSVSAMPE